MGGSMIAVVAGLIKARIGGTEQQRLVVTAA